MTTPIALNPAAFPSHPGLQEPTQLMLYGQKPALFVIVGHTPDGDFIVPIVSARAAAQVVRHLTEYCPHTRATWQVHPHATPNPVVVFDCARPPVGEYLPRSGCTRLPADCR